jgi:Cu+-exporting ATPase
VYEVLQENNLCRYYTLDRSPGRSPTFPGETAFEYLDDPAIAGKLLDYSDDRLRSVTLLVPDMHCSSCIWLLENLPRLNTGIIQSRVNFLKKTIRVTFTPATTVRTVVELLASLGYEPEVTLASIDRQGAVHAHRSLYYKIGVAGFCFGNIMLLSFPEYLGGGPVDLRLERLFSVLSLLLALPVFFYSSAGYFSSSFAGLSRRIINLDVPIALGILILFARSVYDILTGAGPGFLDSMSGLVFFLLIGRLFQEKVYDSLNFERKYSSYFPLAVTVRQRGSERTTPVSSLCVGDRMIIRNGGVVPADAVLVRGTGLVDYSFVTGESAPVTMETGSFVYAGGRLRGAAVEMDVVKEVSQSYLTQLWNEADQKRDGPAGLTSVSNNVAKYFTVGVLAIAAITALLWLPGNPLVALNAVTGVLIVACPCALALSTPFTFGSVVRVFGRVGLYLKNAGVVERLAGVDTIVFDKTGTMTHAGASALRFIGDDLTMRELALIGSAARSSGHPLSRALQEYCSLTDVRSVTTFAEIPGSGIHADVDGVTVMIGSREFVLGNEEPLPQRQAWGAAPMESRVYVALQGVPRGLFVLGNRYREGMDRLMQELRQSYRIVMLTGDGEGERRHLQSWFGDAVELHFQQSPAAKLAFVQSLQHQGSTVLMVGDGLNDGAALRQSDVGISVTEDTSAFTPSSDAIVDAASLQFLPRFLSVSRRSVRIVWASFVVSFTYNLVGLAFAMRGDLTPLLAATLMPLSSVTVVLLCTAWVRLDARRFGGDQCPSSRS